PATEKKSKPVQTEKPRKLSFKEKRRLEELESLMDKLNQEKSELEEAFASGNATDIEAMSARYSTLKDELNDAEFEWLTLSEI
ncbi:MAG: ABC transporter ATP-binding protein, partial [Muribaculaceae bacterium]|nr:ABC transporter ATP-binding protein [Muribaculaceae bacterium]